MITTRRVRRAILAVALLLALLALAHVQSGRALVGVIWRAAVLSWDNPATQLVEEIASGVVPLTDPSRLASEHVFAADRAVERLELGDDPSAVRTPAGAPDRGRAPPAA